MQNCTPQINPADELKVVRWIGLLLEDVKDDLVEHGDWSWTQFRFTRPLWGTACLPVTPEMVKGWAPNIEKIKAAMKEAIRTSATPYMWVVSIRSSENAIPGNTLDHE
jgi:hypothetical protein